MPGYCAAKWASVVSAAPNLPVERAALRAARARAATLGAAHASAKLGVDGESHSRLHSDRDDAAIASAIARALHAASTPLDAARRRASRDARRQRDRERRSDTDVLSHEIVPP